MADDALKSGDGRSEQGSFPFLGTLSPEERQRRYEKACREQPILRAQFYAGIERMRRRAAKYRALGL